jgi:hypothetical protein
MVIPLPHAAISALMNAQQDRRHHFAIVPLRFVVIPSPGAMSINTLLQ